LVPASAQVSLPAWGQASPLEAVSLAWRQGAPQVWRRAFRLELGAQQVPAFPQAWQQARAFPPDAQEQRLELDAREQQL
jgi:hypothetical protein